MALGKRSHPTESLGVKPRVITVPNKTLPEVNTVHAFGAQGNETSGWPYRSTSQIGTPIGPGRFYRPSRLSQGELGNGSTNRRKRKKRK